MNTSNTELQNLFPPSIDSFLRELPSPPLDRVTATFAAAERQVAASRFNDLPRIPTAGVTRGDLLTAGYRDDLNSAGRRFIESLRGDLKHAVNEGLSAAGVTETRVGVECLRDRMEGVRDRLTSHQQATIDELESAQQQAYAIGRQVEQRRQSWLRRQLDRIWRLPVNRLIRRRLQAEERACLARCQAALTEGGLVVVDRAARACADEINRVRQVEHGAAQVEEAYDRRRAQAEAEATHLPHWHEEPSGDDVEGYARRMFLTESMPVLSAAVVRRWTDSGGGDLREALEQFAREKVEQSHLPTNITHHLVELDPVRRRDKFNIASRQAAEACPVKRLNAPGLPQTFEVRLVQVPGGEGSPLEPELRGINPEGCRQRVVDNGDYDDGIWLSQHEVGLYPAQCAELTSLAKLVRQVPREQFARAVTVWPDADDVINFAPELAADSRIDGRCLLLTLGALGLAKRDGSGQYLLDGDGRNQAHMDSNGRIGRGWAAAVHHVETDQPLAGALDAMLAEHMQRLGQVGVRQRLGEFPNGLDKFVPHDRIDEARKVLAEVIARLGPDANGEGRGTNGVQSSNRPNRSRVGAGNGPEPSQVTPRASVASTTRL